MPKIPPGILILYNSFVVCFYTTHGFHENNCIQAYYIYMQTSVRRLSIVVTILTYSFIDFVHAKLAKSSRYVGIFITTYLSAIWAQLRAQTQAVLK